MNKYSVNDLYCTVDILWVLLLLTTWCVAPSSMLVETFLDYEILEPTLPTKTTTWTMDHDNTNVIEFSLHAVVLHRESEQTAISTVSCDPNPLHAPFDPRASML